jgi:hypothetical protein
MQTDKNGAPDVMRANFTEISEENRAKAESIKLAFNALHKALDDLYGDRHMALAKTHLEIASMFAVKSITAEENQ